MKPIYAFEVGSCYWPNPTTINEFTLGRAKAHIYAHARGCYPNLRFTAMRGRKLGAPVDTEMLRGVQKCRGRPDLKAGTTVRLPDGREGVVVDGCSGACVVVLMPNGGRLSVHPSELLVPLVLACPTCDAPHLDEDEWATKPHKTHLPWVRAEPCPRCRACPPRRSSVRRRCGER